MIAMEISGVKGTVDLKGFEGLIRLTHFSFGVGRHIASPETGGDREHSVVTCGDCNIEKNLDSSTIDFFTHAVKGATWPEVIIKWIRTGDQPEQFFEIKLKEVIISSYAINSGSDDNPSESLSLNATEIEYSYTGPDLKNKATPKKAMAFHMVQKVTK